MRCGRCVFVFVWRGYFQVLLLLWFKITYLIVVCYCEMDVCVCVVVVAVVVVVVVVVAVAVAGFSGFVSGDTRGVCIKNRYVI